MFQIRPKINSNTGLINMKLLFLRNVHLNDYDKIITNKTYGEQSL